VPTSTSHKYELRIFWSQEDSAFVVEVPDLPGCMAHGDTAAEAAANAQEAIGLWIDTARELGRVIPPPRQHRAFA
jgi:predicted RNase H-like HicB family nuclease